MAESINLRVVSAESGRDLDEVDVFASCAPVVEPLLLWQGWEGAWTEPDLFRYHELVREGSSPVRLLRESDKAAVCGRVGGAIRGASTLWVRARGHGWMRMAAPTVGARRSGTRMETSGVSRSIT